MLILKETTYIASTLLNTQLENFKLTVIKLWYNYTQLLYQTLHIYKIYKIYTLKH